jgi:hypothetical protein
LAPFSDLLPRLEGEKVSQITFKAEDGAEGRLPISSWSITQQFPAGENERQRGWASFEAARANSLEFS